MPRTLPLLAFLLCTGKAFAALYTGSFTVTLTEVQDMPEYQVGQSFVNTFHYEADAMDGTFYYPHAGGPPPDANTTLDGEIFWAFPSYYDYSVPYTGSETFNGYHSFLTNYAANVTVQGGVVTEFNWVTDFGAFIVYVTEMGYSTSIAGAYYGEDDGSGLGPNPSVFGTLTFSAIQSGQAAVPDGTSTLLLLCGAALASWTARRARGNREIV